MTRSTGSLSMATPFPAAITATSCAVSSLTTTGAGPVAIGSARFHQGLKDKPSWLPEAMAACEGPPLELALTMGALAEAARTRRRSQDDPVHDGSWPRTNLSLDTPETMKPLLTAEVGEKDQRPGLVGWAVARTVIPALLVLAGAALAALPSSRLWPEFRRRGSNAWTEKLKSC